MDFPPGAATNYLVFGFAPDGAIKLLVVEGRFGDPLPSSLEGTPAFSKIPLSPLLYLTKLSRYFLFSASNAVISFWS